MIKLTALDVVRNRLDAVGLGNFILPLQAGRGTSEAVYESIEARLEMSRKSGPGRGSFKTRQRALEKDRAILQGYLDALRATLGSTGLTVYKVIGHAIASAELHKALPRNIRRLKIPKASSLGDTAVEALVSEAGAFGTRLERIARMPALWRASTASIMSHDLAEDHAEAAGDIADVLERFEADVSESTIAVFMTPKPFVVDMKKIEDILTIAARQEGRIDLDLLDTLTDPEVRRSAHDLCGQISERQTILAQLGHSLRDAEGWNIGTRLSAAAEFAKGQGKCLGPVQHRNRLVEIEEEISFAGVAVDAAAQLPQAWTSMNLTLADIQEASLRVAAQPSDVLSVRCDDPTDSVNIFAIETKLSQLSTDLSRISQAMPAAGGLHNANELRTAASTIDGAGFFGRMGSIYKAARNTYANILGGRRDDSRADMARRLRECADWLDSRREFDHDARYPEKFGPHFRGLNTEMDAIKRVVAFHAICKEISGASTDLRTYLECGDLDPVLAFSEIEGAPP